MNEKPVLSALFGSEGTITILPDIICERKDMPDVYFGFDSTIIVPPDIIYVWEWYISFYQIGDDSHTKTRKRVLNLTL